MGLQLRNKTPKRRVKAKLRDDRKEAIAVNETWAMDFVHEQLVTGRKIRVLTVVDTFSRFSPVVDPRFSYKGENVVQTLERACKVFGYPKSIRADNGPEFVSRDLDLGAYQNDMRSPSTPGKPTDNEFIESCHRASSGLVPSALGSKRTKFIVVRRRLMSDFVRHGRTTCHTDIKTEAGGD